MTILKTSKLEVTEIDESISKTFDYTYDGKVSFQIEVPNFPKEFSIGLIVGASGSGKSTLLETFGNESKVYWDNTKSIASNFTSAKEAEDKLYAVGLGSIPTWLKPYNVLSTGEKFRADLARRLEDGAVIDEFTSVVDRNVAKSCSNSINRYIKGNDLKDVVFASCHYDIIEWLRPDWVYDTNTKQFLDGRYLRRPEINIELLPCGVNAWSMFSEHHYLTGNINKSSLCWLGLWGDNIIGFGASIPFPSGTVKNAYRGHRTVILPDYQGMGFGVRLSDGIAKYHITQGQRYFSKTTHPRMGMYRNNSDLWKPTSKNMKVRSDSKSGTMESWEARMVFSYSHEFIG